MRDTNTHGLPPHLWQTRPGEESVITEREDPEAKMDRLKARLEAQEAELAYLLRLAIKTMATEGDADEKWKAHTELMTWFRSNPVRVIEALQAGNAWARRPGGQTTQRLVRSIKKLPICECGGAV